MYKCNIFLTTWNYVTFCWVRCRRFASALLIKPVSCHCFLIPPYSLSTYPCSLSALLYFESILNYADLLSLRFFKVVYNLTNERSPIIWFSGDKIKATNAEIKHVLSTKKLIARPALRITIDLFNSSLSGSPVEIFNQYLARVKSAEYSVEVFSLVSSVWRFGSYYWNLLPNCNIRLLPTIQPSLRFSSCLILITIYSL